MELQRDLPLPTRFQGRGDADESAARVRALSKNLAGHVFRHADLFNRIAQEKTMGRDDEMFARFAALVLRHSLIEVLRINRDELAVFANCRLEDSNFVIGPKVVAVTGCAVADDFFVADGSNLGGCKRLDETHPSTFDDIQITQNAWRTTEQFVEKITAPITATSEQGVFLRHHDAVFLMRINEKKKGLSPSFYGGFV